MKKLLAGVVKTLMDNKIIELVTKKNARPILSNTEQILEEHQVVYRDRIPVIICIDKKQ